MSTCWSNYQTRFHDELVTADGKPRKAATALFDYLAKLSNDELLALKKAADLAIRQMSITFSVYSESGNIDREWPFDDLIRDTDGTMYVLEDNFVDELQVDLGQLGEDIISQYFSVPELVSENPEQSAESLLISKRKKVQRTSA